MRISPRGEYYVNHHVIRWRKPLLDRSAGAGKFLLRIDPSHALVQRQLSVSFELDNFTHLHEGWSTERTHTNFPISLTTFNLLFTLLPDPVTTPIEELSPYARLV